MPGVAPYTIALGPAVNISCGSSVTTHATSDFNLHRQTFTEYKPTQRLKID